MHHLLRASALALAAAVLCNCARAANPCADLRKFSAPATTIEKAREVPEGTIPAPPGAPPVPLHAPAHCRVDGVIGAHRGRDGKAYGIHFAVAMPAQWNGRLLYQGGGGLNGSVQPPIGAVAAGDTPALAAASRWSPATPGTKVRYLMPVFLRGSAGRARFPLPVDRQGDGRGAAASSRRIMETRRRTATSWAARPAAVRR